MPLDQDNRADQGGLNDGYDGSTLNLTAGYDVAVGSDLLLGVSGGYIRIATESDRNTEDSVDVDLFQITGYAAKLIHGWQLSAKASYAVGEADTQRFAFEQITGDYDVDAFSLEGNVQKPFDFGEDNYIAPYLGLRYSTVGTDAYTENGGLNIFIDETDTDFLQGQAGVTLGRRIVKKDSNTNLYVGLGVVNEFNDGSDDLNIAFANQALTLNTAEVDGLRFNPNVGFDWSSNEGLAIGAVGDVEIGDTYSAYSVSARIKFDF